MNPELEGHAGWPRKKIAGVDEAGRGCWAGPVVAAAVILPENFDWDGLNDSKKLSSEQRARLSARIRLDAATGLGFATAAEIDASNILVASLRAMSRAVEICPVHPTIFWSMATFAGLGTCRRGGDWR